MSDFQVSLVVVTSVDGKTTRGDNVSESSWAWASGDDRQFFSSLRDDYDVIILGRATYEVQKPFLDLSSQLLRVVMTSRPEAFIDQTVKNRLEFTDEGQIELLNRLKTEGHRKVLLVSGSSLNGPFLESGMVNDLYVTVEPRLFGSGKSLADKSLNLRLKLVNSEPLGTKGTILLHYEIQPQEAGA